MLSSLRLVVNNIRNVGLSSLLKIGIYELVYLVRYPHLRTLFVVDQADLDVDDECRASSEPYAPSSYYLLTRIFARLSPPGGSDRSVLIDIGCGAGRALHFAADRGFGRVVGIESSPRLSELCERNLASMARRGVCVEVVNRDVRTVDFRALVCSRGGQRPSSVVLFLFDPFDDAILRELLSRLDVLRDLDLQLVYLGPHRPESLTRSGFRVVHRDMKNSYFGFAIYGRRASVVTAPRAA